MKNFRFAVNAALVVLLLASMTQAASIWIEGEEPAEKHVTKHGWYDAV